MSSSQASILFRSESRKGNELPAKPAPAYWLWALLPLLLAAALAIPLLDADAFNGDEPAVLVSAGALRPSPPSFAEVWQSTPPRQPPGLPLALSVWGQIAGWSVVSARSLAFFAGLLAIALLYRTGRDLFTPLAGFTAALLASSSVFFLAYMARASAYSSVALFATLTIWSNWQLALGSQTRGKLAGAGLVVGGIGLVLFHYFASLLLPLLGLFHLFLAPLKDRWRTTSALFVIIAVAGLIQFPLIIEGLDYTADENRGTRVLSPIALLSRLLLILTNGVIDSSTAIGSGFAILLTIPFVWKLVPALRKWQFHTASGFAALVFSSFLLVSILFNELLNIIVANRIRYLMPLWPTAAILAGAATGLAGRRTRTFVTGVVIILVVSGIYQTAATDFRLEMGYFFTSDLHRIYRTVKGGIRAGDQLVIETQLLFAEDRGYYRKLLIQEFDAILLNREDYPELAQMTQALAPRPLLLLGSQAKTPSPDMIERTGLVICNNRLARWSFRLVRVAVSWPLCPDSPARLQVENGSQLTGPEVRIEGETLRLFAGLRSSTSDLLAHYSLAVHVIDPRSGQRVAQGDVGVGPGTFVPVRSNIDISALAAGAYEVHVALYDWQNGERLNARDLATGEVSDMHVLHHFSIK